MPSRQIINFFTKRKQKKLIKWPDLPDSSVDNDYGSSDIGTVLSAQGVTENPETAEDYGFGSHFMTTEDEEELAEPPNFQVKFGFNKGSLFIIRGVKIRIIALL